jgi:hypothetical protein
MNTLNINPAYEVLKFNAAVDTHLDKKVRNLLDRMNRISDQYNDVIALSNEFNLRTNFDDKKVSFIDFEGSEFKEILDKLYDKGILEGERKYKFETKKEIDIFKAKLDGKAAQLKNKNQEPLLLIQPLLNLLEQMNKIAQRCADLDEKLKEKTNSNVTR